MYIVCRVCGFEGTREEEGRREKGDVYIVCRVCGFKGTREEGGRREKGDVDVLWGVLWAWCVCVECVVSSVMKVLCERGIYYTVCILTFVPPSSFLPFRRNSLIRWTSINQS